jgi:hypothetical protein
MHLNRLILNRSKFIWYGKTPAAYSRGSIAESRETNSRRLGGDYAEGERELESALVAMRGQGASESGSTAIRLQNSREDGSDLFAG